MLWKRVMVEKMLIAVKMLKPENQMILYRFKRLHIRMTLQAPVIRRKMWCHLLTTLNLTRKTV